MFECTHLGEELEKMVCPTCSGRVQIKIFSCRLHEKCTINMRLLNYKCCAMCQDYVPAKPFGPELHLVPGYAARQSSQPSQPSQPLASQPQPSSLPGQSVVQPSDSSPGQLSERPAQPPGQPSGLADLYEPDPDLGTPDLGTPDLGTPDLNTP
jgi:hypothetical protein